MPTVLRFDGLRVVVNQMGKGTGSPDHPMTRDHGDFHVPKAVSAYYDRKSGHIVINLASKLTLSFSPRDAQGLEQAKPSQLDEIEISPSGFGIHFPRLDADLFVPGLLEGFLGSRKWMAAKLGQAGGQSR